MKQRGKGRQRADSSGRRRRETYDPKVDPKNASQSFFFFVPCVEEGRNERK
jgi:hypothetical protein